MATEFEKLKDNLLALPIESRASLAHALIESLDGTADDNAEDGGSPSARCRDSIGHCQPETGRAGSS
jgi:hypothetical protein